MTSPFWLEIVWSTCLHVQTLITSHLAKCFFSGGSHSMCHVVSENVFLHKM